MNIGDSIGDQAGRAMTALFCLAFIAGAAIVYTAPWAWRVILKPVFAWLGS